MVKRFCIVCAGALLLAFVPGCNSSPDNSTGTYKIKAESERFQGKLVSNTIERYEYDPQNYELKVTNGQQVKVGTVLMSMNEAAKESLASNLMDQYDIESTQSAKRIAQDELTSIMKADYSPSEALLSEYTSLKERLGEIQTEIKAQEIVIETAQINYEYELAALKKGVASVAEEKSGEDAGTEDMAAELYAGDTSDDAEISLEIERLTKLYEQEQKNNYLQLEQLQGQYSQLQDTFNNFQASASVKNRAEQLRQEIAEYEQIEEKFKQELETMSSDAVVASCDGMVVIDVDSIYVYSNLLHFTMTVSAQNFQKMYASNDVCNLEYNNEVVGTVEFSYYIPSQTENMYDLVYAITYSKDVLPLTNTYAYMVSEEEIFIPAAYISQNADGSFFVRRNKEDVNVEVDVVDGQYKLLSGLSVGDEIERIN